MSLLAYIGWRVLDRIHLGPLTISPHGIGIALGYAAGGNLLARRAERMFGIAREHIWNMLMYAVLGVVVGARLFYVLGHIDFYATAPLDIFKVWEGGIVLYGGIFGGIAAAYPYARKHRLNYVHVLDAAAPGFPLGLIFGRLGDLIIGDHLGGPTTFFLGWQYRGGRLPDRVLPIGAVVHQPALYDLMNVIVLLPVLLYLSRRPRPGGFLITFAAVWYAIARFATDFARTKAATFLWLHGTQWVSLAIILGGTVFLLRLARRTVEIADDSDIDRMIDEGSPVTPEDEAPPPAF